MSFNHRRAFVRQQHESARRWTDHERAWREYRQLATAAEDREAEELLYQLVAAMEAEHVAD